MRPSTAFECNNENLYICMSHVRKQNCVLCNSSCIIRYIISILQVINVLLLTNIFARRARLVTLISFHCFFEGTKNTCSHIMFSMSAHVYYHNSGRIKCLYLYHFFSTKSFIKGSLCFHRSLVMDSNVRYYWHRIRIERSKLVY